MKTDKTKNIWVDLDNIPKIGNRMNWKESVGCKVPFQYNDINGVFNILDYCVNDKKLTIQYNENPPYRINRCSFITCTFGEYIGHKYCFPWKYNIGQIIKDDKRDITIVNRKLINNKQHYQYVCNKCGFDCHNYYDTHGNYNEDFWMTVEALGRGTGCSCCSGRIVALGINDIPTTDPWMIPYFQGGEEEARKYTSGSSRKVYPICPDCGKVRNKKTAIVLIRKKLFSCVCSDNTSYPNKFSYALLEQLPVKNWEIEYNPDWLKSCRYDNYFEYKGASYILEMDGGLGHGNNTFQNEQDIYGIEMDKKKDKLAKEHSIKVIRIDCLISDIEYIKNNIIKSYLNEIFDLSNIDWCKCDIYAKKNIIKEICMFWEENDHPRYNVIKEKFHIKSSNTISKYLQQGSIYGWCNYYKGFYYDECKKIIDVYNINKDHIGTYFGARNLSNQSEEIFGVYFPENAIYDVCNKKIPNYKDYIFEWAD